MSIAETQSNSSNKEPHCSVDPNEAGFCDPSQVDARLLTIDNELGTNIFARCQRCAFEIVRQVVDPETYSKLIDLGLKETVVRIRPLARTLRIPLGPLEDRAEKE